MTIWKTSVDVYSGRKHINVPKGARFLSAQIQNNLVTVWYDCDPSQSLKLRTIYLILTGAEDVPPYASYLGTCMLNGGAFVVHVFVDNDG